MKCNYCEKDIVRNVTIEELFFKKLITSELCSFCRRKFTKLPTKEICSGCGRPFRETYCLDCLKWQQRYPTYHFRHRGLYQYNEAFKEWMYKYKFLGDYRLRYTFSDELVQAFKQYKGYIICPLPLSVERERQRGFNQTLSLVEACHVEHQALLKRDVNNEPQAEKSRRARLLLPQPFTWACKKQDFAGKKILLFDDIYTTGRTLFHAAEKVRECQPKELQTFSLAR